MPVKTLSKSFAATLTRSGNALHWVVIAIPFDVTRVWGVRGQLRVKGEINGFAFRTSLFPSGDGRHFMIVNKQMQKGGKVQAGMSAHFKMDPDLEKRAVPLAPEFDRALGQSRLLRSFTNRSRLLRRTILRDSYPAPSRRQPASGERTSSPSG